VDVAHNGAEAVTAVQRGQYDLILMDCHMPEMDGFAASTAIRQWEKEQGRRDVPVVALTADVRTDVKARCRAAGMTDYLSKPFTGDQLTALLSKWLGDHITPAEAQSRSMPTDAGPPEGAALDTSRLEQLRLAGPEVLESVINRYVEHAPVQLDDLQVALISADAESLTEVAHSLKSASASIGATELATLCAALEKDGRQGELEQAPGRIQAIADKLPEVIGELQNYPVGQGPEADIDLGVHADGQHVWLVDDDAGFRDATATALTTAGFRITTAPDGDHVLSMSRDARPDLLMLDAVMGDPDGFEVCRRLNQQWEGRDIPILMVTGLDDLESVRRAFDCGAAGFIVKPINYPVLIHQLLFELRASGNQKLLRENRERLATAQRMVGLGYWRWDSTTDSLSVSEELAGLCGTTPREFGGDLQSLLQRVQDEDRQYVRQQIQQLGEQPIAQSLTFRLCGFQSRELIVNQELNSPSPDIILGTMQDVTEQKRNEEQIRKLAYTDALTSMANRPHFEIHLKSSIRAAERHKRQFALMYVDLDGFKDVNDSLGHDVGDDLLVEVGRRLASVLREKDFAARLGGDEFCLIIEDTSDDCAAANVAIRCMKALATPIQLDGQTLQTRASIGIARYPQDGKDGVSLKKCADSAMYAAKRQGKGLYAFYLPELTEQAKQRLNLESELRRAIEHDELLLHYQPLVSLVHGRLVGVEALLRWDHPERGLLIPDDFLDLAKRINLAATLDFWVLEKACRQLALWQADDLSGLRLTVNCSTQVLQSADCVQRLEDVLERSGVSADRLELDITGAIISSEAGDLKIAQALHDLGVKLAIDHFGTELSSWSILKRFPLDSVKLDRQFVQDMLGSPEATSLLGSMVAMSRAMRKNLLVEGVETLDQVLVLSGFGCETAQGNFFSPPVPVDHIPVLAEKVLFPPAGPTILPRARKN